MLVTLLLAVVLPLCCCDVRTVLGGIASLTTGDARSGAVEAGGCCQQARETAPSGDDEDRRSPNDGTCPCTKVKIATGEEKTSITELGVGPLLAYASVLFWVESSDEPRVASYVRHADESPPPLTALVRLHCALVI